MEEGHIQMDHLEGYYRQEIEKFIEKFEQKMSKHLDSLQKQIANEKQRIFSYSHNSIKNLTVKSSAAKKECHKFIENFVELHRQKHLNEISHVGMDKDRQFIGYEQLRKLKLEIYSTAGMKEDEQGCENIPDRKKRIKDIEDEKPNQPLKRTVYIGMNDGLLLGKRNQGQ
ncbi:unnamed protein product [Rotaria sordida]|uniref:Uncharacterized protein n=1 Tax=Rotaria sordida TaxID=392033 RepID=A0A815CCI1_9BILA|nr:unnamed protein product [Rotaria sordida]CAF3931232.1 unnamed protein product [Rotaria sordida]